MPKRTMPAGMSGEWSFPVEVGTINADPQTYNFHALDSECANLARRAGVEKLEGVEASVTVMRMRGGVIHAMGSLRANVTQSCVVTLTPIHAALEERFEGWYGGEDAAVSFARAKNERDAKKANMEMEVLEESVDPEPIIAGLIDLGELAAQHLCLSIKPYPRAPGAAHDQSVDDVSDSSGAAIRKNPFEALKDWKEKR
jgi:hypothetical protein